MSTAMIETAAPADRHEAASPFAHEAGTALVGEVVTWDVDNVEVRYVDMLDAIRAAGLDASLCKPVPYSDAFRRAMKKMESTNAIVRKLDDNADLISYQVTREQRSHDGQELLYSRDHLVILHKADGSLECNDESVREAVKVRLEHERDTRNGNDVSRVVMRTFQNKHRADLDLIPLRSCGGVYFVRLEGRDFLDRVEHFLSAIQCRLNRYPIARSGDNRSVCEAVAEKMRSLIEEYDRAVEGFGGDTRKSTPEQAAARIQALRFKVSSYAEYLGDRQATLGDALARSQERLARKLAELAAE